MTNFKTQSTTLWRVTLFTQAGYYTATGIWPIVSIESFQAVTGRKTDHLVTGREGDHWLVMTVAALIVAIGLSLLASLHSERPSIETAVLASSAAFALICIDVIYVTRCVLSPIYLADAAPQAIFLIVWCAYLVLERKSLLKKS